MNFNNSLELVYESLLQIKEQRGGNLRASAESLTRLIQTKPPQIISKEVPPVKEEPPIIAPKRPEPQVIREIPKETSIEIPRTSDKTTRLAELKTRALICEKCPDLVSGRTQVIFGSGNLEAKLMFVGEAPGEAEDFEGEPFVDPAGQLLTKIIETMGFNRDEVYITTVLKCRHDVIIGSSGNKKPKPEEVKACFPYLSEQIEIIQPSLLIALGATAMEALTGTHESIGHLRGQWHEFKGIPLMPTYHPAYLIHKKALTEKRKVWEDMLQVLERIGKPISKKQQGYFLPK